MHARTLRVLYWIVTLLFVVPQLWSAIQMLTGAPRMTATIVGLGYPIYVMKILGVAKILGAAAILYGRFPLLKEWAYVGFTFDVIGAFCSHVGAGDPIYIAFVPLVFLALQLISYLLWKRLAGGAVDNAKMATGLPAGSA